MSGTIRSRMEAIQAIVNDKQISTYVALEMIDKLAADTLTDLNNARWDVLSLSGYKGVVPCRSIPDPDSRGAE